MNGHRENAIALFFHERDIGDSLKELVYIYGFEYENPLSDRCSGFFVLWVLSREYDPAI